MLLKPNSDIGNLHVTIFRPVFAAVMLFVSLFRLNALNPADYRFYPMPETSYYGGIHSIAKDTVGRIWFTGSDALYMYDGLSFSRFNEKITSMAPDAYWSYLQIAVADGGQLYLGTNSGLMRLDYGTMEFERVLDGKISFVTADSDGLLWIIRNDAVESYSSTEPYKSAKWPFSEKMPVSASNLTLACSSGEVYVASQGVLYILDRSCGEYVPFVDMGDEDCIIRDVEVLGGGCYILTAKDGVYEADPSGHFRGHYKLPKEYERSSVAKELYIDSSGAVWAATQSGIFVIDPSDGSTVLLRMNLHSPYSLPNNSVWTIYPDPDCGVWIGTYGGKLAYMPVSDSGCDWFRATPGGLNHSIVSCFEEDADGNLWIGTEGGGINRWDRKSGSFIYYTAENNGGIRSNMIKKFRRDASGRLVAASFNGGMVAYDTVSRRFAELEPGRGAIAPFMAVYDFMEDIGHGFWVTDPDSPLRYLDLNRRSVEQCRIFDMDGNSVNLHIETLFRDGSGNLCLVTQKGLYIVDGNMRIVARHFLRGVPFAKNDLCCFCRTSGSDILLGTRGGGVNILAKDGSYSAFCDSEGYGLDSKTVFGILEDLPTGNVWFSTNDGLFYYDREADLFRRSTIDARNLCGAYYLRSCFRTSKGEMLFGGTNGFIVFEPSKAGADGYMPKPYFVQMKINSEQISAGTKGSPLAKDISVMSSAETIVLSHRQANIELSFSSDCYLDSEKTRFAYRMTGISDNWNLLPQEQRSVAFFDLHPGKYCLEIRTAGSDGVLGEKSASLRFKVRPSPFLSVWAYIIYVILCISTCILVGLYLVHKKKFRIQLDRTQAELQELYSRKYVAGPSDIVVSSADDELLKKALDCIERNMDNSEYDVDSFVSDMAMGRTALYQKISDVTGLSIKEFILDIRLKRAAQLLRESDKTISEISYMTGFVNPKYFSTCFKRHFSQTPSDYKKNSGSRTK